MGRKKKQQNSNPSTFELADGEADELFDTKPEWFDAVIQEANREFFHPLGLEIRGSDERSLVIDTPNEQPMLKYGDDVKQELENVKAVQKMRVINTNKRIKTHGYRVQPVHLPK